MRRFRESDGARWDDFVQRSEHATFFHRVGWKRVIEESLRHPTYHLLAEREDQLVGVLPLVHVRSRLFGNALISSAFCVEGGPAALDDEACSALTSEAVALADKLDVDYLEFRCPTAEEHGWRSQSTLYAGFRREIDRDLDEAMRAIPRKQRAMIRKAQRNSLVGVVDENVERFYSVYATSVRNLGTPVLPRSYFASLKAEFGDACEITTVLHEGRPVSSVMSFYFRDSVLPYYGGSTEEARDLAANDLMYWEVMQRGHARQCRWFDFGRSKAGTGAFAFKKNWGFTPQPLTYCFHLRRGRHELPGINPLNPRYRLFIWGWQRLPLAISKIIGPKIARLIG